MKKKGFTLIELLAVIVILAIIALIATPLVLKYIEYSKEKSAKLSAQIYVEAVEKEYVSKLTNNEKMPNKEYTIKELDELGVKVKGDKPEGDSDTVTLQNGNVIKYTLTINDYVITYEDGNTTVTPEKDNVANNDDLLDHTVKFMADGELYEIVSVKDGNPINAPLGIPTSDKGEFGKWSLNGSDVTFPYIPTEDVEFTAMFEIVSQKLYSSFGVDRNTYPYILIYDESWTLELRSVKIFFCKEITYDASTKKFQILNGYLSNNIIHPDGDKALTLVEVLNALIPDGTPIEIQNYNSISKTEVYVSGKTFYTNNNVVVEARPDNTIYFE